MPYIAQVAVGKLPHINIYGSDYDTPDGTGVRDFIHVLDLAEGHLAAVDFLRGETGFHAFNLGTGRGQSVLEMMKAFEATCGKRLNHRFEARRSGDVASCYANPAKAMMQLGWKASRTVQDMCASTWRWQNTLQEQLPIDLAVGR